MVKVRLITTEREVQAIKEPTCAVQHPITQRAQGHVRRERRQGAPGVCHRVGLLFVKIRAAPNPSTLSGSREESVQEEELFEQVPENLLEREGPGIFQGKIGRRLMPGRTTNFL